MSKPATHRFIRLMQPQQGAPAGDPGVKVVHMYRLQDGMRVATAKAEMVQYGEDPQQLRMRIFLDHDYAVSFLRNLADRDWAVQNGADPSAPDFLEKVKEFAAEIDDKDMSPRILAPDQMRSRPVLMSK